MSAPTLRLFTFSPAWGLPTIGPFGLKLEACLRLMGVPYERVIEDDPRKGPKGKSPWIEDGGVRLGDTELILAWLAERYGKRLDAELSPAERARSVVYRRALEESWHQVFEYELCVPDAGWDHLHAVLGHTLPPLVRPLVARLMRRAFVRQLHARGIARHTPAEVTALGRAEADAWAELVSEREWLVADHPTKVDATAFGLLGIAVLSDLPTPVCSYARTLPPLVRYVERARDTFFPELASARPRAAG